MIAHVVCSTVGSNRTQVTDTARFLTTTPTRARGVILDISMRSIATIYPSIISLADSIEQRNQNSRIWQ
jgi:hypothetical protein